MFKISLILFALLVSSLNLAAQNTNSSTTTPRPRTTNVNKSTSSPTPPTAIDQQKPKTSAAAPKPETRKPSVITPSAPGSEAVIAAFNGLLNGIRRSNVDAVTGVYWKSPSLVLFNYNGTVTKGWDQMRKNRESSYPEVKDVKLDVRDLSVTMLGRDGAVVSCLWTQSQTYKGAPETVSGRMTLVFKRVGTSWKAVHLHTSTDAPNPATIPPSEQTPKPSPSPNP